MLPNLLITNSNCGSSIAPGNTRHPPNDWQNFVLGIVVVVVVIVVVVVVECVQLLGLEICVIFEKLVPVKSPTSGSEFELSFEQRNLRKRTKFCWFL